MDGRRFAAGVFVFVAVSSSLGATAAMAAGGPESVNLGSVARLDSLLAAGNPADAAAQAELLLARSDLPERLRGAVLQRQCVALRAAGRPSAALPICEAAVLETPGDPVNHQNLATCLQDLGQLGRAAGEWQQALESAPDQTDWRLQYARVLLDVGARRESRRQIEIAAQTCPDCPQVDLAFADQALRTDHPGQAIAPLQRLLRASPSARVRLSLVQACYAADRLAALDSALAGVPLAEMSPDEIQLWLQADRQRSLPDRARRLAPGGGDSGQIPPGARRDPRFWALISELCLLGSDPSAALAAIDSAIAHAPQDGRWQQNRAAALIRLGREAEAAAALARARELGVKGP